MACFADGCVSFDDPDERDERDKTDIERDKTDIERGTSSGNRPPPDNPPDK